MEFFVICSDFTVLMLVTSQLLQQFDRRMFYRFFLTLFPAWDAGEGEEIVHAFFCFYLICSSPF